MSSIRPKKSKSHYLENDKRRNWRIERIIEQIIWSSRFLVFLAVFSSLLASLILFCIGTYDVINALTATYRYFFHIGIPVDLHGELIGKIIGSIDIFLIAVVLLIFSFGLYELFISHIDVADKTEASNILEIESLDVLKDKIGQVIIMALIVKFFQVILTMNMNTITEMLLFACSVAALSLALFLMHLGKKLIHEADDKD